MCLLCRLTRMERPFSPHPGKLKSNTRSRFQCLVKPGQNTRVSSRVQNLIITTLWVSDLKWTFGDLFLGPSERWTNTAPLLHLFMGVWYYRDAVQNSADRSNENSAGLMFGNCIKFEFLITQRRRINVNKPFTET